MTTEQIKDIILVAEFDGYKFNAYPELKHFNITKPNENKWYFASWDEDEFNEHIIEELPYHSDWNLLMRVVEKIASIDTNEYSVLDEMNVGYCSFVISDFHTRHLKEIYIRKDIWSEAVFEAIVIFLKWQEENNK